MGKHFYLQMHLLLPRLLQHIYPALRPNRLPCHSELETSDEDAEVPSLIAEGLLGRPGFEGWLCNSKKKLKTQLLSRHLHSTVLLHALNPHARSKLGAQFVSPA